MGLIRRIDNIRDDVLELVSLDFDGFTDLDFRQLKRDLQSVADRLGDVHWDLDLFADKLRDLL